jgi:hypothetical protein
MDGDNDLTTQRYRESVFVGRSTADDEGGPTFELAVQDAYQRAKEKGKEPPFKVLETWVDGTNPLSEYLVSVKTR